MTPPTVIDRVHARQILDSRGNPTVEVEVTLASGAWGRAAVPSGASTGAYEAVELRDDENERYGGKGVRSAVDNVLERIAPEVIGRDAAVQRELDDALRILDATPSLSSLGANAVLGVSLAAAHAAASHFRLPLFRWIGGANAHLLPVPFFNVVNGGAHADNAVDVQEFMVAPVGAASFSEALRAGAEVYASLRRLAASNGLTTNVGDEGGIAPALDSTESVLDLLMDAVRKAGYEPGDEIVFALDVAATELYDAGAYKLQGKDSTSAQLAAYLSDLAGRYPIVSIEDGCAEEDWDGWEMLTAAAGDRVQLVGDDLIVTNPGRLRRAIESGAGNAVLIKPNQIGTLSSTLDACRIALQAGWGAMMSHRSGETEDVTISHLAVATGVGQIKSGAPARGERTAKYNELLRIEEALGSSARYAGRSVLRDGR